MKPAVKQPPADKKKSDKTSAETDKTVPNGDPEVEVSKDVDLLTLEDIREQIRHIEKSVSTKELHFMTRVVRSLLGIRRKLSYTVLHRLVQGYYPNASPQKSHFLDYLPEAMETDVPKSPFRPRSAKSTTPLLPEVEVYLHLLLLIFLIDDKRDEEAIKCSTLLMERLSEYNRRSLDMLSSRAYFYHSRVFERAGRLEEIRGFLHARLRTCTLRKDADGQAMLINLLLRNYLQYHLYDQAHRLVTKVSFPDQAPNNEWARYLYYLGHINAIQLEYSAAHQHLVSALRKAPQHTAVGFKQTVHKLNTVVELLLGEQPDRSSFRNPALKSSLQPYFQLTQAVRVGNLALFNTVVRQHGPKFRSDGTYILIVRLRHNVIKTGVKRIALSYSRISLSDVATRLQLDSPEDAEFIIAKAIRDGVIEAYVDHDGGYVQTKETLDIYSTGEPLAQFHQRVAFCLNTRNQSVRAMRYPPKQYTKDLESAEERREREQQELESAKELSDDDFEGFP